MSTQLRWIAAAIAALAVGQVSAQSYTSSDYGYGNDGGYGYGHTRVVRCESVGSRSNFCRVDIQSRAYVSRQLSQRQCVQGRNWNYSSRGISVTGGCRADFAVVTQRHHHHDGDSSYSYNDSRYNDGRDWDRDGYNRDYRDSSYDNYDSRGGDTYQDGNSDYYYQH